MHYKTLTLQILRQRPKVHNFLKKKELLLKGLEKLALTLQTSHQEWIHRLEEKRPGSSPSQTAAEALELALYELEERLPLEMPADTETISLDTVMALLLRDQKLPA